MWASTLLLGLVGTLVAASETLAFDITFPGPSNYWVACGWNQMTWKNYAADAHTVTIMLTNSNKTLLNDDFEVGNAVQGSRNAAMVYVPCVPPASGYSLMFVDPVNYDHKPNKVLYTTPQFVIKPKGSAPDPASGQTSIPSKVQPFLNTPGIVLPASKTGDVTNTTAKPDEKEDEMPKLDSAAIAFGSLKPTANENAAWSSLPFETLAWSISAVATTAALLVAAA